MAIDCLCAGILFADYACAPVPKLPEAGELVLTERMQLALGGCASNAALDLARLGVEVGVAGCVGDDVFGQFVVKTLADGGANTGNIRCLPGQGTASSMIINVQQQDRRFISSVGANAHFTVDHIPADWVRQAKVFYMGGYLMMDRLDPAALAELFKAARAGGARTVLDVVLIGDEGAWDALCRVLPETDVFLPNDDEAALLTGRKDPLEQAERFREVGAKTVVITCGSEGSLLVTDGLRLRARVYPTEFVGGAGSGDAFDAGYIAGLLADEDPAGCLRWGSALGASCVRSIATTDSVFDRSEAEAFMKQHELKIETF